MRHVYTCKCGGEPYHIVKSSKMELCFPTLLFAFSKACFKLSDQASM